MPDVSSQPGSILNQPFTTKRRSLTPIRWLIASMAVSVELLHTRSAKVPSCAAPGAAKHKPSTTPATDRPHCKALMKRHSFIPMGIPLGIPLGILMGVPAGGVTWNYIVPVSSPSGAAQALRAQVLRLDLKGWKDSCACN